jgi:hypothetical protein
MAKAAQTNQEQEETSKPKAVTGRKKRIFCKIEGEFFILPPERKRSGSIAADYEWDVS